ncbi:MAG: E3 binding domain-containing protein, partial [Planctomycetia bacterium]|nr:E3 binding domain-containing protein [Planctomycetia bacterium]
MTEFKMPSLGADMDAGLLVAWQKQPGDAVHRGDLIAEVETDKGIIEIEAFGSGVLDKILVPVGEKVPVGTVLALIRDDGVAPGAVSSKVAAAPAGPSITTAPQQVPAPAPADDFHSQNRLPMSPSARRLARELGIDPTTVRGTGHGGAITREDIQRAVSTLPVKKEQLPGTIAAAPVAGAGESRAGAAAPASTAAERSARMRQIIAAAMSRSKR